jgi:hypothetical protein
LHPEDGACTAPEAWQAFLQQPGHENLRLDLGHCGGPWDFAPNSQTKTIWTETVIKLLGSGAYLDETMKWDKVILAANIK